MEYSLASLETWFWISAIIGTVIYVLKFVLMILGVDPDLDFDSDAIGHVSSDSSFSVLSVTSLTGFAMLFGWGGLTATLQFGLNNSLALIVAVLCGCCAFVVTAVLGKLLSKLVSEGEGFTLEKTIGQGATVYQRILPGGTGKIHVSVNGLLHEIDACSHEECKSGESVQVVELVNPTVVLVKRV